jgi:photosystem II stability/assembly factor-like uncharacterized protein
MTISRIFRTVLSVVAVSLVGSTTALTQWNHTSGSEGGYAAALLGSSHFMLLGCENGGVYRSTDAGNTWFYAFTGLSGRGPGGYAFAELGTSVFVATGTGIAVSFDQGATWSAADNGLAWGSVITGFAVGSSGKIFASGSEGVYRSNDSGATWVKSATGLTDSLMSSVLVNGPYIFAGTHESGIFRSTDDGVTWAEASNGLASGNGKRITALTSISGRVVAATRGGAYYSTDNGNTWVVASSGLSTQTVSTVATYDTVLVAGTYGFGAYRSTDKGVNWVSSSTGWPSGNVRTFCKHNGALFGGNYGFNTVFKSTDAGVTWSSIGTGITSRLNYGLASTGSRIFCANAYGIEYTSDNGSTWVSPPFLFGRVYYSVYAKGNTVYAGSSYLGPFISTDNGATWDTANGGGSDATPHATLALVADSQYVFAGTYNGVYRTTDNGASWTPINTGLVDTIVYTLCSAKGHLYAGTGTGIFMSTNHGSSWTKLTGSAPTYIIESIVGIDSVILAATRYASVPSTFRSTDYGASWNPVTNGVSTANAVFHTLLVDGHNLFGGSTTEGVWLSTDFGVNWTDISSGLSGPALRVTGLAVSDYALYAGTRGGIWSRPISQVVSVENSREGVAGDFVLMQNYPNPFNGEAKIGFRVSGLGSSWVRLVVYDLLGREVAVLVDGTISPGNHETTWNAAGFSSGVYYYRLTTNQGVITKTMTLLK